MCLLALAWCAMQGWDRYISGNRRIDFYGRMVDSSGQGLEGVAITACISRRSVTGVPFLPYGTEYKTFLSYAQTKTDRNGDFSFTGLHGRKLEVMRMDKEGYFFDRSIIQTSLYKVRTWFNYGTPGRDPWLPDRPEQPFTFTLTRGSGPVWKSERIRPARE
jgi:hypothetical protein